MQQRNTNSHKWAKKLDEESKNQRNKDNASDSRKP